MGTNKQTKRKRKQKKIKLNDKGLLIHHSFCESGFVGGSHALVCSSADFWFRGWTRSSFGVFFSRLSTRGRYSARRRIGAIKASVWLKFCYINSFTVHPDCCTRVGGKTDLYSPGVAGCKDSHTGNDWLPRVGHSAQTGCESVQQRDLEGGQRSRVQGSRTRLLLMTRILKKWGSKFSEL